MRRLLVPVLLLLSALLAGCFGGGKNPVKPTPGPAFTYSRSTPQAALASLVHAYNVRDSVEYGKLYAPDYQGASYDTSTGGPPQPGTFTRDDEIRHIRALAEDADILSVSLNLNSSASWVRQGAVGPQGETWAEIVVFNPKLQIDTHTDSDVLTSNEVMTFTFSPETPATGSPTDTLWSIVRWAEDGPP